MSQLNKASILANALTEAQKRRDVAIIPHRKVFDEATASILKQFDEDVKAANAAFLVSE